MNKMISTIGASTIAAFIALSSLTPAVAAPMRQSATSVSSNLQFVQYRDDRRQDWRHSHRPRHESRHSDRRGYWNGHRGYRDYRRGYRRGHDGFYYPLGAFEIRIR